jgi:DNA helicase II / ATP-dependent DNA helicase PcrA
MSEEIQLSEQQQEIVGLSDGEHLVLAPPGTGKTELLARRVSMALQRGIPPEKMICLTFTNRAAKGMKERVDSTYPGSNVFIGNIHNLCINFLYANKLIPRFMQLLDEEDQEQLITEAKETEQGTDEKIVDLIKLNNYLNQKKYGVPPTVIVQPDAKYLSSRIAKLICQRYEKLKKESWLLDFDDLLTLTYTHLSKDVTEKEYKYSGYTWLQVDEVQDLNPLQWEIIRAISEPDSHKVYFGDYEQAIFSFMGARVERLKAIEQQCTVHNMQKNFRSPSYLLKLFVDFAKAHLNPGWLHEPVAEHEVEPKKDYLLLANIKKTDKDEYEFIADKLLPLCMKEPDKQTAIIVRFNRTADAIANVLSQRQIQYFKISGFDLFRRKSVKDIMAFLTVQVMDKDRMSWARMFEIFAKIESLKAARGFVNTLFDLGFAPADFLSTSTYNVSAFEDFAYTFRNQRMVVFDTETTGLNTDTEDIIQIAAIELINGKIGQEFEIYLHTDKDLTESEKVHKISKAFLDEHGVDAKEGLLKFNEFVNGSPLLAHNLYYDWNILNSNNKRRGIADVVTFRQNNFDSLFLTRRLYPALNSYRLTDLITTLEFEGYNTHNALDDVRATVNLLVRIIPDIEKKNEARAKFLAENVRRFDNFRNGFSPLWQKCKEERSATTTFPNIINGFLSYMEQAGFGGINSEDSLLLQRLLRHMEIKCGELPRQELLKKYLPEYKLYKESDLILGDEQVVIVTVHKAKGLEFENVIIPECVQDVYPSWSAKTPQAVAEDARLLYVALTRAKKRLYITTHEKEVGKNGQFFRKPSPFLDCIRKYFREGNIS